MERSKSMNQKYLEETYFFPLVGNKQWNERAFPVIGKKEMNSDIIVNAKRESDPSLLRTFSSCDIMQDILWILF